MSNQRKKRKAQREEQKTSSSWTRKLLYAVLIVAAFAAAYYLGLRKRTSRLDTFAQCLTSKQLKMYGAYWCPHCAEQKEMFGDSFQYVPYIECGVRGSRDPAPACVQAGIKHFPTWQFADGERREGALGLQTLSEKSGCPLP
jgi:hypothetical protein